MSDGEIVGGKIGEIGNPRPREISGQLATGFGSEMIGKQERMNTTILRRRLLIRLGSQCQNPYPAERVTLRRHRLTSQAMSQRVCIRADAKNPRYLKRRTTYL